MKVELVSYKREFDSSNSSRIEWNNAYKNAINIVKSTTSDLVVFCGGLLLNNASLKQFINDIKSLNISREIVTIVEVWKDIPSGGNHIHILRCKNGNVADQFVDKSQLIVGSDELQLSSNRDALMSELYNKLQSNVFNVKGKNCMVIQCGEINFIEGYKKLRIRGCNSSPYMKDFNLLLDSVDIMLDVVHTPMTRYWVTEAKYAWFSSRLNKNKACFAVCNSGKSKRTLDKIPNLQFGYQGGKNLNDNSTKCKMRMNKTGDVIIRIYSV